MFFFGEISPNKKKKKKKKPDSEVVTYIYVPGYYTCRYLGVSLRSWVPQDPGLDSRPLHSSLLSFSLPRARCVCVFVFLSLFAVRFYWSFCHRGVDYVEQQRHGSRFHCRPAGHGLCVPGHGLHLRNRNCRANFRRKGREREFYFRNSLASRQTLPACCSGFAARCCQRFGGGGGWEAPRSS